MRQERVCICGQTAEASGWCADCAQDKRQEYWEEQEDENMRMEEVVEQELTPQALTDRVAEQAILRIARNPRTGYIIIQGNVGGSVFYDPLSPTCFDALVTNHLITKAAHQEEYGPEYWLFCSSQ